MASRAEVNGLCRELELAEDKCSLLFDRIAEICGRRPPRKPSRYQLFVGKCIKEEREEGEPVTEVLKRCVVKWREEPREQKKPGELRH